MESVVVPKYTIGSPIMHQDISIINLFQSPAASPSKAAHTPAPDGRTACTHTPAATDRGSSAAA